jgi:hypothetical protein
MQQKTETQNNISRDLYNEVAGNREVLKRVDENAALDTPEDVAALNAAIHQLKAGTAYNILYDAGRPEEGTFNWMLSKAQSDIFFLKAVAGQDNSPILPEKYKPLLKKIRPQTYLRNIKKYTEEIYKALST